MVDMDELQKEMPSQWLIVGKYYTTHTFSSTGLFNHMHHVWQLRGGAGDGIQRDDG